MYRPLFLIICGISSAVQADVLCWVSGAVNMNFGTVSNRVSTNVWNAVQYSCQTPWDASGTTYHIRLCHAIEQDPAVPGWSPRKLRLWDGSLMNYDLYQDPGHTLLLGPLASSAPLQSWAIDAPMNSQVQGQTILYGQVPATQGALSSGTYESHFGGGRMRWRWSSGSQPAPSAENCRMGSGGSGGGEISYFLNILANAQSSCLIEAAAPLDFGVQVQRQSAALRQQGRIAIRCPASVNWSLNLDQGLHAQGNQRYMVNTLGEQVAYNLFRDSAYNQTWGTVSGSGTGNEVDIPVYGEVPVQSGTKPGDYNDTLTVTLTW